jgi:hypothetical protein
MSLGRPWSPRDGPHDRSALDLPSGPAKPSRQAAAGYVIPGGQVSNSGPS